ncbi:hypothetical protein K227x_33950 [Rubripirellula lacrimiformis]|uniref:DUF1501 domain-containing protein n=2 Tax=Rubripirellula lacrimiformis TaxID=1930273 RepID=A0A517NCY0_9BACT|nr:hypothetical protein K227x_33950 [Rubripirellula lacrimiformis]
MKTNRREFLKDSSAVSLGAFPSLICRGTSAAEDPRSSHEGKILVVIQMSGGNDGINTVVPFADEGYAQYRSKLRLPTERLLKLNDSVALHPSMRAAADLIEDGRLAIVQGVGYPNPSRSHDTSMAIWHSAEIGDEDTLRFHGWLGTAMDAMQQSSQERGNSDPDMVLLGDESQPLAIQSRRSTAVTLSNLTDLRLSHPIPRSTDQAAAAPPSESGNSLDRFVAQTMRDATDTASGLEHSISEMTHLATTGGASYPSTMLGNRMQTISTLIKSGFSTPVYYAIQSGYDTHSAQLPTHSRLLREFSDAIKAFLNDLDSSELSDQVCVLGFSEFGRRVAENGSGGTDHGTAGPVFVASRQIRPGLIGSMPSLQDLSGGDLRMNVDFRSVYHEVTTNWLGVRNVSTLSPSQIPLNLFQV